MIPFDSAGASTAFVFKDNKSNSAGINISWHFVVAMVFLTMHVCSSIYFCLFRATTFMEYSDAFYATITVAVALCSCILQIIVRPKMIALIDNFEIVIKNRKSFDIFDSYIFGLNQMKLCLSIKGAQNRLSKEFYVEGNEFVEKWTKIIYFFLTNVASQSIMISFMVLSYTLYFVVDSGKESFNLPLVIWSVLSNEHSS